MKIRIWDRIVSAIAGLVLAVAAIGLFAFGIGIFPFRLDFTALEGGMNAAQRTAVIAGAVVLFALGAHGVSLLLHRRHEKGFVIQRNELGDMSISMNALESMVCMCVQQHPELQVRRTQIARSSSGISVETRILLKDGANIPTTVNALQKQIKQYITSCSGVEVEEVRVLVETNASTRLAAPQKQETGSGNKEAEA